jgi:hypothetical protein
VLPSNLETKPDGMFSVDSGALFEGGLVEARLFDDAFHEELGANTGKGGVEMLSSASRWRPENLSSIIGFGFKDFANCFFTVVTARLGVEIFGVPEPVWRAGGAKEASKGFTSE